MEIPRRRRVHNLRQKDRRVLNNLFVILIIIGIAYIICYSDDPEIGAYPISFFIGILACSLFHMEEILRGSYTWHNRS